MRPFEANGIALGLCGQWLSQKLVQKDETRPHNLPLRFQRVRISPSHEAVVSPGTISELVFGEISQNVMLLDWATPFRLSFQFGGFGEGFDTILNGFTKSYVTDFRDVFDFCNDTVTNM
jgi:hypothetical protein